MDAVEVVVAHAERATLRVGDVFVKVDADRTRIEVEVEAMTLAPVPTPRILWSRPPVLAIAALPGTTLVGSAARRPGRLRSGPLRARLSGSCMRRRCRRGPAGPAGRSTHWPPSSTRSATAW